MNSESAIRKLLVFGLGALAVLNAVAQAEAEISKTAFPFTVFGGATCRFD